MHSLAMAGEEGAQVLFWVLAGIVWVIVQIVKAKNRSATKSKPQSPVRPPPAQAGPKPEHASPEAELRKFLEGLGAPVQEEPTPPPPPPAVAPPPPPTPRPRPVAAKLRPATGGKPQPVPTPVAARAVVGLRSPYDISPSQARIRMTRRRREVVAGLNESSSLKNAILLKEILGPPVALRQHGAR